MTKVTLNCARCGKEYHLPPSAVRPNRLYCSNECRRTRTIKKCEVCQAEFEVKPAQLAKGHGRFCSRACHITGSFQGETRNCVTCSAPFRVSQSQLRSRKALYCSKGCCPQLTPVPVELRFWDKVLKGEQGECWEWLAFKNEDGYGQISYKGRMQGAHRIALLMLGIEIPKGQEILHSCDNPSCVNPGHLSVGTHHENITDMVAKGRYAAGRPRGETHAAAKLTEEIVREARLRHMNGESNLDLARFYGVGTSCMHSAISRKTWRHVQ